MPDNKPAKHHYIPQGYLRGFAEVPNVLYVADKGTGRIRTSSPKGMGYLKDYYTVDTIDEKDSAEVEEGLGKIETTCIPLLKKLTTGVDLTNPERADVAIYTAIQYGRTPFARERMDEVATVLMTNVMKQKLADAINDPEEYKQMMAEISSENPGICIPSKEELKEWVLKPGPLATLNLDNGTYVTQFFENSWNIGDGLLKTQWTVYHAPRGASFITSDNPIGLELNRSLEVHEVLAILLPGVTRYFPLNSKACLVMTDHMEGREIKHVQVSKSEVRKINKLVYSQAHTYAISGNKALLGSFNTAP